VVNVRYLTLVGNHLSDAFAGEELAKRVKLPFEPALHEFIARIFIARADLPPVVNEPILLDLDNLRALVVQQSALWNEKCRLNPNADFRRPRYAELLDHSGARGVLLSSWKLSPEF
jgi:hypothetical protein